MREANILGLVTALTLAFSSTVFAADAKTAAEPAKKAATETKVHPKHHAHHKHHKHHKHHAHKHHHHHHHHHAGHSPFDGYYVGGSAGGVSTNATQEKSSQFALNQTAGFVFTELSNQSGPISLKTFNSGIAALYAGYGQCWDEYYLGAELFINLANYKNNDDFSHSRARDFRPVNPIFDASNASRNISTRLSPFQFGVDIRPGLLVTPESMLYARVGVAFAEKTVRINDAFTGETSSNGAAGSWNFATSAETEKDVAALRLGAGLETHICNRWNMRMDYIYTYYGHNTVSSNSGAIPVGVVANVVAADSTNVKIYNNTVMLGLSYSI